MGVVFLDWQQRGAVFVNQRVVASAASLRIPSSRMSVTTLCLRSRHFFSYPNFRFESAWSLPLSGNASCMVAFAEISLMAAACDALRP